MLTVVKSDFICSLGKKVLKGDNNIYYLFKVLIGLIVNLIASHFQGKHFLESLIKEVV